MKTTNKSSHSGVRLNTPSGAAVAAAERTLRERGGCGAVVVVGVVRSLARQAVEAFGGHRGSRSPCGRTFYGRSGNLLYLET